MRVAAALTRLALPPETRYRASAAVLAAIAEVPTLVGRGAWAASQGFAWIDAKCMDIRSALWEAELNLRSEADWVEKPPYPRPPMETLRALIAEENRQRAERIRAHSPSLARRLGLDRPPVPPDGWARRP